MSIRYAIVIERTATGFSAYVPDLPGCVAAGATVAEAQQLLRDAIQLHINGRREDQQPVPPATSVCDYVDADVA
jgi:predicted RNase H-like HicB family nuclease